jgi:hypothetical protein
VTSQRFYSSEGEKVRCEVFRASQLGREMYRPWEFLEGFQYHTHLLFRLAEMAMKKDTVVCSSFTAHRENTRALPPNVPRQEQRNFCMTLGSEISFKQASALKYPAAGNTQQIETGKYGRKG